MRPESPTSLADAPEPRGDVDAEGFSAKQCAKVREILRPHLHAGEQTLWTFARPKSGGDEKRAITLGFAIAGCLFFTLTLAGTQDFSNTNLALLGAVGLLAALCTRLLWDTIARGPENIVPGFAAALTDTRLVIVNLDSPRRSWSMEAGDATQITGDGMLHQHGGVWVAGLWMCPDGTVQDTKVPVFTGKDTAATVQLFRKRLLKEFANRERAA
ncbi:MAG: hypothetical protein ACK54H_01770 [Phycisphaerales bacterium]|jgi:hypothetical protein